MMRSTGAIWGLLLAMGATPAFAKPPPAEPNLAACPRVARDQGGAREHNRPLPVPTALRGLLRADLNHYAVATLAGSTLCVDTSFMEGVDRLALSPDARFLSFAWHGYEAYGHVMVDRTGKGTSIDTGVAPTFSPSHGLLAAVETSEAGFGSLNAFAVWRVDPAGIREIARVDDLPSMSDWRIDRWARETCIVLSALPLDAAEAGKAARRRYAARPKGSGWIVVRGACPSA
jgi:hypothetical protein